VEKPKSVIPEADSAPARREFLRLAGLGALGLTLSELSLASVFSAKRAGELLLYVGTYTTGKSEGIYLYRLDISSGELKRIATTKRVVNPSFLALAPSRRYLYAVLSGAHSCEHQPDRKKHLCTHGRHPLFCSRIITA